MEKKIKIILEYLNRYKFLIAIGLLFIMGFYGLWMDIRNSQARSEMDAGEMLIEQRRVEETIVPEILDKMTTNELTDLGRMWGE